MKLSPPQITSAAIVEDEGHAQRQQYFTQLVAAHKAQEALIERKTQEGNCEDRGTAAERKAPGMNCSAEADISAHQIKRAVSQIDDAQQTRRSA